MCSVTDARLLTGRRFLWSESVKVESDSPAPHHCDWTRIGNQPAHSVQFPRVICEVAFEKGRDECEQA